MLSFDEALAAVVEVALPVGTERIVISAAATRILASPVIAGVDSPPADVSAMDGYAIRDDVPSPYRLVGASFPGCSFAGEIRSGECVRIFTGGTVPEGADRVVVQELVRCEGAQVYVESGFGAARHIRRRGSDFVIGDQLVPAGRVLNPRTLLAAAGADLAEVKVLRRPTVAVLGTGDELAEPGTAKQNSGSVPESVTIGVSALVEQFGGQCVYRSRLADDLAQIQAGAAKALKLADVLVITGGASVGEKDFAKAALAKLGLELIFSKVAIKPGKPVWFGRAGGRLVMGLPGNPTSALVTARLLLAPLIGGMSGHGPRLPWRQAILAEPLPATGDRETFVRGRWERSMVVPVANQDSGAQRALAESELLIRRSAGSPPSAAGELVGVLPF